MPNVIMLPPKQQRFDASAILDTWARGKAQDEQKRQFDAQMEEEKKRTAMQQGQLDLSGRAQSSAEGQVSRQQMEGSFKTWREISGYDQLVKAGDIQGANKKLGAIIIAHPEFSPLIGGDTERAGTQLDTAAANIAKYTADQTGKTAGGSQDVQAANLTNKLATGEQLSGPAFADQSQRQTQAYTPPKGTAPYPLNPNAPETPTPAYGDFLQRQGGAKTTAAEDLTAGTQVRTANIHEAGATEREQMGNASAERMATARNAMPAATPYDLSALSPGDLAKVEMLAAYKMNPKSLSLRTGKNGESERSKFIALARLKNPDYNEMNYDTQAGTAKNFASGKASEKVLSFNTAAGHLGQLDASIAALENGDLQILNKLAIRYKVQTGQSAPVVFNAIKNAVAGELATTFKGSSGTDPEIAHMNATLQEAQSPEQLHAAVDAYLSLMHSRLSGLEHSRQQGMSDIKSYRVLSPEAEELFSSHGIDVSMFSGKSGGKPSGTSTKPKNDPWGLY